MVPTRYSRLQKVRIWRISSPNKVERRIFVGPPQFLTIEDVEEVRNELQFRPLGQAQRIIRMDIKPSVTRCTTLAAATTNRNFARIQVNWMRIEFADWKPGLEVYIETKVQTVQRVPATLFAEAIAAEHVNDVSAIAVQRPNGELIT
jgi:hypothetical protein